MSERKLTLEIIVDQGTSDEWKWLYDTLVARGFINGIRVCSISNDWVNEESRDLLMSAGNAIRALTKKHSFDLDVFE